MWVPERLLPQLGASDANWCCTFTSKMQPFRTLAHSVFNHPQPQKGGTTMARHPTHVMIASSSMILGLVVSAPDVLAQSPRVGMHDNRGTQSTIDVSAGECVKRAEAIMNTKGLLSVIMGNNVEGLTSKADIRVFVDCVAISEKSTHVRIIAVSADDSAAKQLFDDVNKAVIK